MNLPKVCCDRGAEDITEKPRIFPNRQTFKPVLSVATTERETTFRPTITTRTTEETTPFTTSRQTLSTSSSSSMISRTVSKPKSDFSNLNTPKCGIRTSLNFRITFGETASGGQFPWVVYLIYKNRRRVAIPLCGGDLVSPQHVLTAAHCYAGQGGFSLASVILGQTDISAPVELPGVEVEVEKVIRHPQFRRNPVAEMDIAVIKLMRPVKFSDMIHPICLYSPDLEEVENPVAEMDIAVIKLMRPVEFSYKTRPFFLF